MKALLALFALLTLGCSKISTKGTYAGEYEWVYSNLNLGTTHSFDTENDKYGVRVKASGKVFFFKNGKRVVPVSNMAKITVNGDTLTTDVYPYDGFSNKYVLIK